MLKKIFRILKIPARKIFIACESVENNKNSGWENKFFKFPRLPNFESPNSDLDFPKFDDMAPKCSRMF